MVFLNADYVRISGDILSEQDKFGGGCFGRVYSLVRKKGN